MFDLVPLTDTAYVIECPSQIGVVKVASDEVVLIDSGNNKDAGTRILKIPHRRQPSATGAHGLRDLRSRRRAGVCDQS